MLARSLEVIFENVQEVLRKERLVFLEVAAIKRFELIQRAEVVMVKLADKRLEEQKHLALLDIYVGIFPRSDSIPSFGFLQLKGTIRGFSRSPFQSSVHSGVLRQSSFVLLKSMAFSGLFTGDYWFAV